MVHRLLEAAIKTNADLGWTPSTIDLIAQHCNDRKLAGKSQLFVYISKNQLFVYILAKSISDKSAEMFLSLFIRQSGPVIVDGVIIQVMDHSMDCVLGTWPMFSRVARLYS